MSGSFLFPCQIHMCRQDLTLLAAYLTQDLVQVGQVSHPRDRQTGCQSTRLREKVDAELNGLLVQTLIDIPAICFSNSSGKT